jgi:cytochrome c oxidase assembly protein subunit 15
MSTPRPIADRGIALWLLACCVLIFAMVVLGGVTRLTRSGLSIVEWAPLMGVIPPLNEQQWRATFERYQQFPEYRQVNRDMQLQEFKTIFWIEYAHRLLGRAIGVVFLLPFLYFLVRRRITRMLLPKLLAMFVLGGLQAALGWLMVESGLVNQPHVSQYRLTAHLLLAVLIYGYIFWVALGLLFPESGNDPARARFARRFGLAVTALLYLMIASGGLVAGTRAGFAFNTFPLMNEHFIPAGWLALKPLWRNLFENIATVQFDHRMMAYLLCMVVPLFWYAVHATDVNPRTRIGAHTLLALLALQVTLGISTLLLVVPVPLAAAHQGGALALFTAALFVNHALSKTRASTESR